MERKRTKAAVGEVGGWAAPDRMAAQVTSMARLERDYLYQKLPASICL